ncbi:MAG: hypothetical protein RBS80_27435 [Thermoguttaceae bacterium]|nr:hypothetical protein [Thermoguttaceae bacterium]
MTCEKELRQYLRAVRESDSTRIYEGGALSLDYYDSLHTNLNWHSYSQVCQEMCESIEFILLPVVAPELMRHALELERTSTSLLTTCYNIAGLTGYDDFAIETVSLYEDNTALGKALKHGDYSFDAPPQQPFPFVLQRLHPGADAYTHQFVSDHLLFSPTLKGNLWFPLVSHTMKSHSEFHNNTAFVHELVHVMQRALRKNRVPAYPCICTMNGYATVVNPETYVQVGVEDELEVQKILVAAGYQFSLNPILYSKKKLALAFKNVDRYEARRSIRTGIECIDFQKYEGLYNGDIRAEVMRTYVDEVDAWML